MKAADAMDMVLSRHTYAILKYLHIHPGTPKNRVALHAMDERSQRTLQLRAEELVDAGLVEIVEGDRWNARTMTLTPAGQLVAMKLDEIRTVLEVNA